MLKSILLAAAVAVVGSAAVAEANWSGSYAGLNLMQSKTDFEARGASAEDLAALGFGASIARIEGAKLALRGGHDWQLGNLVLGAGGEVNLGMQDAKLSTGVNSVNAGNGITETLEFGRDKTVYGRAGYVSGNFLAYGLAGWTWADGKGSTSDGVTLSKYNASADGMTLGLGGEYQLRKGVSVYGEYTRVNFDNLNKAGSQSVDIKSDRMALGLNLRF